jgi:D-serine deaminase-like pyridoxal phosphate-dependent protein
MTTSSAAHLHLRATVEKFPFKQPFCITGYTIAQTDVLRVEVEQDGLVGRGEASGVYYKQGDSAQAGLQRLELIRSEIEQGVSRSDLQLLLPAGAARNALPNNACATATQFDRYHVLEPDGTFTHTWSRFCGW